MVSRRDDSVCNFLEGSTYVVIDKQGDFSVYMQIKLLVLILPLSTFPCRGAVFIIINSMLIS